MQTPRTTSSTPDNCTIVETGGTPAHTTITVLPGPTLDRTATTHSTAKLCRTPFGHFCILYVPSHCTTKPFCHSCCQHLADIPCTSSLLQSTSAGAPSLQATPGPPIASLVEPSPKAMQSPAQTKAIQHIINEHAGRLRAHLTALLSNPPVSAFTAVASTSIGCSLLLGHLARQALPLSPYCAPPHKQWVYTASAATRPTCFAQDVCQRMIHLLASLVQLLQQQQLLQRASTCGSLCFNNHCCVAGKRTTAAKVVATAEAAPTQQRPC